MNNKIIKLEQVDNNLLASLDSRDAALWIRGLPTTTVNQETIVSFVGLPWRMVLAEKYDQPVMSKIEIDAASDQSYIRKRGFVHLVENDASRIDLPPRCLPVYLLNGRSANEHRTDFQSRLRRMTMLDELVRSGVRHLVVVSDEDLPIPPDLDDLWSSGFRSYLTILSNSVQQELVLSEWLANHEASGPTVILGQDCGSAIENILRRYENLYPDTKDVIRVRDSRGATHSVDITTLDEPERPLTQFYSLLNERDLAPLMPADLSEDEFVAFFRNSSSSWRPYAAGLPWLRDVDCGKRISKILRRIDSGGPDENCIAYISAESGSGGTTLARALAWEQAKAGYPVLLANQVPFSPEALPVVNFLSRINSLVASQLPTDSHSGLNAVGQAGPEAHKFYQVPWLLVFDSLHWQYRETELVRFLKELTNSGRSVCILLVAGSLLDGAFEDQRFFKEVAQLNHAIGLDDAESLGRHLNRFLVRYGKARDAGQWQQFYQNHTVRSLEGLAAFWVTLSFWIQGQYDLSVSIQEWVYRNFKEHTQDPSLRIAILRIAAMSTERLPLPERLLPRTADSWPVSHSLADASANLAGLGLVRVTSDGEKHWALIHDILGRFLINAVFYDYSMRSSLEFEAARDPEHMRFLLLRQMAKDPLLGERRYLMLGEEFATSIFKIDPDHGRASFAMFWREVIAALNEMPKSLRDGSRVFRHHMAISRRRIAKLGADQYGVTLEDQLKLLEFAIRDLRYALDDIEASPQGESNLNLLNSLANAYFDLAEILSVRGEPAERVTEVRRLANEATRRAFEENPTNSFVIETYVKNLLQSARNAPAFAVENCVEALGVLFSAMSLGSNSYRSAQLAVLAERALGILLTNSPNGTMAELEKPATAVEVLVAAWKCLAADGTYTGVSLSDFPEANRIRALDVLECSDVRSNTQVMRLRYELLCINQPAAFSRQLELVEQLIVSNHKVTPQLRLEYAVLLFQNGRALEGDKEFRALRQLWKKGDYFVEVPERLKWLRGTDYRTLKTVQAIVSSDMGIRPMAKILEFSSVNAPFRPEEHGFHDVRPNTRFRCHVSFGANGPFLRPTTAGPV